jgi:hypothetical protein
MTFQIPKLRQADVGDIDDICGVCNRYFRIRSLEGRAHREYKVEEVVIKRK